MTRHVSALFVTLEEVKSNVSPTNFLWVLPEPSQPFPKVGQVVSASSGDQPKLFQITMSQSDTNQRAAPIISYKSAFRPFSISAEFSHANWAKVNVSN